MCRVLGAVGNAPISLRHELLDAQNPMIRQSEEHDSGWGAAVYVHAEGEEPTLTRFAQAAFEDEHFIAATEQEGRIFNVHVRRATLGGLTLANTHPFVHGAWSYSHNGTVIDFPALREPGVEPALGDTDSEQLFNFLLARLDPTDVVGSLRRTFTEVTERSGFSGLNCLLSDGKLLYAYKLGIFDLHWLARPGELLVASERITDESWQAVDDDVLLILDPGDPSTPRMERLVGDDAVARAHIQKYEEGQDLRGEERGAFAAERADGSLPGRS